MLGLDGIHRASFSRIGPIASARSSGLTTIGLSRRFLAGSNAAADNYRIGNARSSFHGGLSRTRGRLPPPPPSFPPHLVSISSCRVRRSTPQTKIHRASSSSVTSSVEQQLLVQPPTRGV